MGDRQSWLLQQKARQQHWVGKQFGRWTVREVTDARTDLRDGHGDVMLIIARDDGVHTGVTQTELLSGQVDGIVSRRSAKWQRL